MKSTKSTSQYAPFLSLGLSAAIPMWLLFRQSLQKNHWKTTAQQHCSTRFQDPNTASEAELIQHWLAWQPHYAQLQRNHNWVVYTMGGLLGFLSMLGGLNYSGNEPINLWLLLGLFSLLPLWMSGITGYAWLRQRRANLTHGPTLLPIRYGWANRLFAPQLNSLSEWNLQNTAQKHLLQRWLIWRLQGAALAFQLSAIVTFVLILVFKDIAFGWSSTIIQNDAWIPTFIDNLARPWSWLIPPPSVELIANSRFYRGQVSFDAATLGQWWSYVLLAMITYGYLPRLLLSAYMKVQIKKTLLHDMQSSGELELFIRVLKHVDFSQSDVLMENNPEKNVVNDGTLEWHELDASQYHLIAWQYPIRRIKTETTLGKNDWDLDTTWIQNRHWQKPTAILAALDQTPTAELADSIAMINEHNPHKKTQLIICISHTIEGQRELGQLKSWQYFASSNRLDIAILNTHLVS